MCCKSSAATCSCSSCSADLNESGLGRVEMALTGVERGAKLSSHLLAFARRQPLQAVVIDPGDLLRDMDDMMRRVLGPRALVATEIAPALGSVLVDPSQLNNVLLNLAINARDAMPGGGTLTIRAANVEPGMALPPEVESGRWVLIEVLDTGKGMPPEVLERAFEPFFTTKPTGQGTGLGLSMAYGFVKQSGGEIVLESVVGKGTGVRIYLPRSEADAVRTEQIQAAPLVGGLETILVVEDEEDVRSSTCGILSALGYHVLQAPDAAAAVAIVESGQAIDLVFTDVIMPGPVSSLQLGEFVQAFAADAAVIYLGICGRRADARGEDGSERESAAETLPPGCAQRAHPSPAAPPPATAGGASIVLIICRD
jgi:CheY-like chemotaxis protein